MSEPPRTAGSSAAELTVGARTALETEGGLPTGERHPFDGEVGRIGDTALDTPLTDLERDEDGWARVRLRGRPGSWNSRSTSSGRGCRSTPATSSPRGSTAAASPSSR